jgi:hypothetical protein
VRADARPLLAGGRLVVLAVGGHGAAWGGNWLGSKQDNATERSFSGEGGGEGRGGAA